MEMQERALRLINTDESKEHKANAKDQKEFVLLSALISLCKTKKYKLKYIIINKYLSGPGHG
jgi:hypothetical protein